MIKQADWVTTAYGGKGIVRRVAKDGSWADVDWGSHSKRMPTSYLIVKTSIDVGGMTITDLSREQELGEV